MPDTIFDTCGLMVAKLDGVNGIQPFVIEHTTRTSTTWASVVIAAMVCIAIVCIALIAARAIKGWHERKIKHEENLKSPQDSNPSKPTEKTKDEYLKQLLEFLEELSKNEKTSRVKGIDDPACEAYIRLLAKEAGLSKDDTEMILQAKNQEFANNNQQTQSQDEVSKE